MTAATELSDNLELEVERAQAEHEHLEDELQDLDAALKSIEIDTEPVPELQGIDDAGTILRNLERELPLCFLEEEGSLLNNLVAVDPELEDWAGAMARNHDLMWQKLEKLLCGLRELRCSTDLVEDLEKLKTEVGAFRQLLHNHALAESAVAASVAKQHIASQ